MRTYLLPFIFTFLVTFSSYSQTNVSGVINNNTTWTKANSPYVLSGDVTVSNGVTLMLEAGVEVHRDQSYSIIVYGVVRALGEQDNPIVLSTSESFYPDRYLFELNSLANSKSSFNYVKSTSQQTISISGYNNSSDSLLISNSFFDNAVFNFAAGSTGAHLSFHNTSFNQCGFVELSPGKLSFNESVIRNTGLNVKQSKFKASNSIIVSNLKNVVGSSYRNGLDFIISAKEVELLDNYMDSNDLYSAVEVNSSSGDNLIKGNAFGKFVRGIVVEDHQSTMINNNNFLSPPYGDFIRNESTKDIDATSNYFYGYWSMIVEFSVYDVADNPNVGDVDINDISLSRLDLAAPSPPTSIISRGHDGNVFSPTINLDLKQGNASRFEKLRVYKTSIYDLYDTTFYREYEVSELPINLSSSEEFGYCLTGVFASGRETSISHPFNNEPEFLAQNIPSFREDEPVSFEITVRDHIKDTVELRVSSSTPEIVLDDDINIQKVKVDTTSSLLGESLNVRYRISFTPNTDKFGVVWLAFELYDGINKAVTKDLEIDIESVSDGPPVFTSLDTLGEVDEDSRLGVDLSYILSEAVVSDVDNDPISFTVTEFIGGHFEDYNGNRFEEGFNIPNDIHFALWVPKKDTFGVIGGFKIRAFDGEELSEEEHLAVIEVNPVNDLPSFNFVPDPDPAVSQGGTNTLIITGISDGPNENEPLSLSYVISNESIFNPGSISVEYEEASGTGTITYSLVEGAVGTAFINIYLSDPLSTYSQEVQISLLPESTPPEINVSEHVIAYTDYPFYLDYNISDDQGYYTAIGATDSDWIQVDNRNRIQRVTQLLDSYGTTSNGLLYEASADVFFSSVTDKYGNLIFSDEYTVRSLSPDGFISTIAGSSQHGNKDGTGKAALLSHNRVMAYDSNADLIYVSDFNNNLIKTINRNLEVEKFIHMDSLISNSSFVSGGIDGQGNLYVASSGSSRPGKIFKISPNGDYELYAGGNQYGNDEGHKDEIRISVDDMEVTQAGVVYFSVRGLVRKISLDGHISKLNLPDVILAEPRDVVIELEDDDHLLVYQQRTSKLARINLSDESYELLTGTDSQGFENNILAEQFGYNGDGPYVYALEAIDGKGIFMSVVVDAGFHYFNDYKFIASISPNLDSIQGTASIDNIGEHEVTITAKDFEGNTSTKTITIEVRENNKIETSNISQTISFDEDTPLVDIEDIVLSGLPATEQAKVTIEVDVNTRSAFTADSGNGESFDTQTGIWTITGNQSEVNAALAGLALIPGSDYDQDFSANIIVVNAAGGVPNEGVIQFKVNPVADLPRLVTSITDSAYVEIPYEFEFELEDPDSYVFNLKVDSYPEWMMLSGQLWAETYSGFFDYNGSNVNGDLKSARFDNPRKLKFDQEGNLYVIQNSFVRKISKDGQVTNFLNGSYGYLDGDLPNAYFDYITDMTFDKEGNIYVADGNNRRIRKIDDNGTVTTIAGSGQTGYLDGNALEASFNGLRAIEVSENGEIYILDSYFVRKLDTNGQVTTIAGNGSYGLGEGDALNTPFYSMTDLEIDSDGNLIIADDYSIRKLDLATNQVIRLAGNGNNCCNLVGSISETYFRDLNAIEVVGDVIYAVTDDYFFSLDQSTDQAEMLARYTSGTSDYTNEGELSDVTFNEFGGLAVWGDNIFLSDYRRHVIRRVYSNNTKLSGTPQEKHIGENKVEYTLIDASQNEHTNTATINVQPNGMPVFAGLENEFMGMQNSGAIDLKGISISNVQSDSVNVIFTINRPDSGYFNDDPANGIVYSASKGELTMNSTEASINSFLNELIFTPKEDFYGKLYIDISARNYGGYFTREDSFKVNIQRVNANPDLRNLESVEAMVDFPLELELPVADANDDPIDLKITGLPDWLELKFEAVFESETVADMQASNWTSNIKDGGVNEAVILAYGSGGFVVDDYGVFYFINYDRIQRLEDGEVTTVVLRTPDYSTLQLLSLAIVDGQLFAATATQVFKVEDGGLVPFVGAHESGHINEKGSEARFTQIRDIIGDGKGGLFIADQLFLRHADAEGRVSLLGGNGEYYGFDKDGPALETPLWDFSHFQIDADGKLLFGLQSPRRVGRYEDGFIEKLFPSGEGIFTPTNFNIDRFGNGFDFRNTSIYLHDSTVGVKAYVGAVGELQWGAVSKVLRNTSNSFYLFDRSAGDIKLLTYDFKYVLSGTPPEGSEGATDLNVSLNDGYGEEQNLTLNLNVLASDRPTVTGLPQSFTIDEASEVVLDPIAIDSDGDEFELSIDLTPTAFASVSSDERNMDEALHDGTYTLNGSKTELNNLLSSLTVQLDDDFDEEGKIILSVKEKGGKLAFQDTVHFSITPINDAPQILNLKDTTAFISDSLAIVVDAFDVEDGRNLTYEILEKPEWLNFVVAKSKSELYAGNPNGNGFFYNKNSHLGPYESQYITFDYRGDIILTDAATHSVVRVADSGEISLVAGTGRMGYRNGTVLNAEFHNPTGVAADSQGNIYIADEGNNVIRLIDKEGNVSTLAGSGQSGFLDGTFASASFDNIQNLELSKDETKLYVQQGNSIRLVDLENEYVFTTLTAHQFLNPIKSFDVTDDGEFLLAIENTIAKFSANGLLMQSYSNQYGQTDGPYGVGSIANPIAVRVANDGTIYFVDQNFLRKITTAGNIETLGGRLYSLGYSDGIEGQIGFESGRSMLFKNDAIYLSGRFSLRKIILDVPIFYGTPDQSDIGQHQVSIKALDTEGEAVTRSFNVEVFDNDRLLVSGLDTAYFIKESTSEISLPEVLVDSDAEGDIELTIALEADLTGELFLPDGDKVEMDAEKNAWYFVGTKAYLNELISTLKLKSSNWQQLSLLFDFKKAGGRRNTKGSVPVFVEPDNDLPTLVSNTTYEVEAGEPFEISFEGYDEDGDFLAFGAQSLPNWTTADSTLVLQAYVNTIYSDDLPDTVKTKRRVYVNDIAITPAGDTLIAGGDLNKILKLENGEILEFAGTGERGYLDGPIADAKFRYPNDILVRANGDILVADTYYGFIRKIGVDGNVSTVLDTDPVYPYYSHTGFDKETGDPIPFRIEGITEDEIGNLFTAEVFSVGKIDTEGTYSHYAGDPAYKFEFEDQVGSMANARFANVKSVTALGGDSLLVWDNQNFKLKLITSPQVSTIAGANGIGFKDGELSEAQFGFVSKAELLRNGNVLFFDQSNLTLRLLDLKNNTISSVLGKGYQGAVYGFAEDAVLDPITAIEELSNGDILLGGLSRIDRLTSSIRKVTGVASVEDVGQHKFTLKISDGRGGTISEEITINVVAPNTAPEALDIADVTATYGDGDISVSLFEYFNDKESADTELTYEVSLISVEDIVAASPVSAADGVLSLSVIGAGESDVTVVATDPEGLQASTTFKVTVAQAEAFVVFGNSEFINDETEKSVEVTTVPEGLNYTITYNGSEELPSTIGDYEVVVTIDEANYYGSGSTTLNVLNSAPYIVQSIDDMDAVFTEDLKLEVLLSDYFADLETNFEDLVWNITSSDEGAVLDREDAQLSINGLNAGESTMTISAIDSEGLQASTTFKVTVAQAEASVVFGNSEFINDETEKSVEVTTVPEGLNYTITYNGSEELPSTIGDYEVVVTIDEANYYGSESTTLSIQNVAPEALCISNLSLFENQEGGAVIGELTVVDQNPSDTHTYRLESGILDNDLFEINEDGLVSKTSFNFEEQATYLVAVEAIDNYGGTFTKEFTIEIQDVNETPTIDDIEAVEIVKNLGQLSIDLTGIGAGEELDQDVTVTASVSGVLASAQVNLQEGNTSGTLIFETSADQEGEGLIAVSVKDNGGTENGGVDELILEIPIKVLSPNIQVVDGSNCGAGIVTLTASGADSFVWYDSPLYGNSISTDNQLEVDLTNSNVYYVSGVFDGVESNLRVPVKALIFDELTVPELQNIDGVLSTEVVDGLSYQWLLNGSPIDGAISNEYTPEETGNYAIEIINENGCMAVSANLEVVITAIEPGYEMLPMRAYPSPADRFITLEFDMLVNKGARVELIDQSGKASIAYQLEVSTNLIVLDVTSVSSGVHTVIVKDGVKLSTKKVLIQR